jgi:hypothetical protein
LVSFGHVWAWFGQHFGQHFGRVIHKKNESSGVDVYTSPEGARELVGLLQSRDQLVCLPQL